MTESFEFKVGDLVIDNDTCVLGLIVEVNKSQPTLVPFTTEEKVNYTYKVQLFRPTTHESIYSEHRLTLVSRGDREE